MTVEVQHDVRNMPTPYGVTNVISKMLRALTTDWIPTRFFRGNKTESASRFLLFLSFRRGLLGVAGWGFVSGATGDVGVGWIVV